MEIDLLMRIVGDSTGAKVQILRVPPPTGDFEGEVLVEGRSWNDVERCVKSAILLSQGRKEEP